MRREHKNISKTEDYGQAVIHYKKALGIQQDYLEAHYGLAVCYSKLDMVEDEIWQYKRILAIKPDMLSALVNLGNAYLLKGNLGNAILNYRNARMLDESNVDIRKNLAFARSRCLD